MFRISLIVCALLILDVNAKPWSKLKEKDSQEVVVSLDDKGKMLRRVEVEPPEDMDALQYNVDPRMQIWKGLTDSGKQPVVAEEDLDKLYHQSPVDVQEQNEGFQPVADMKEEPFSERAYEEPEEDMDELYHKAREQLEVYLAPLMAEYRTGEEVSEPEEDAPYQPALQELQRNEAEALRMVRVHLQPEEDRDHLYHTDPSVLLQNNAFPEAAAPVEYPFQRKHAEPEDDLDGLFHQ